jgi:serine/threonine protein kinase
MEQAKHWEKIKELFGTALEKEPGQRGAFLRDACGHDEALRAEVESLLAEYDKADGLSEHLWPDQTLENGPCPESIGPYRLVKKIGEGGMGQVWLAEQTAPVRRQVALKLIKAGLYDPRVLQRFQSERQSLAIMDHPSIAKVFDAGATPEGQPYFVMEYVPGLPITDYCDQKKLEIRERLELLIKACEGVQHAHQKAIIHRDLKPANILVVEVDGKPMPRIIDFGLAKAAAQEDAGESLFTQAGSFLGTPGYMSPEQADPNVKDVDTRTDVYSLGVVLYVLLTGFLPFDAKRWQKQPYEILRQLREEDPARPSTKIAMEKESSSASAEMRGTERKQLISQLRGDLDWIAMKVLEKDRARRYGTPSELAADIRRYLNHEPVVARPASAGYKLQKYAHRHRLGVAVAAGLVLLLAGFAVLQAVQLRRITRERDRASRVTGFMTSMFKVSDPSEARGNTVTARQILDKASKDINTELVKDPELQAQMMQVMGEVYKSLGLYSQAQPLLERAVEIRRKVLGPGHRDTLTSMYHLAWCLETEGHYDEAEKLERQTLDIRRRVLGPQDPDTLTSMDDLAWTLMDEGNYPEAEKLNRETLAGRVRVLGPEHPDTINSMKHLASSFYWEKRYAESEQLDRQALAICLRVFGPDHPEILSLTTNLTATLEAEGRLAEAENFYRQSLETDRRVMGPEHPGTLLTMRLLAACVGAQGRWAEAKKLDQDALDIALRTLGPENPGTLDIMNDLALALVSLRQYPEAEKLMRQTRDTKRRVLGADNPWTAASTYNLAEIVAGRGRSDEALSLLHEAIDHGLPAANALAMENDSDLKALQGDPRFIALVAYVHQRAAPKKPN